MSALDLAKQLIQTEEGLNLKIYPDSKATWAIGWGRNLSLKGISKDEADLLLTNDLKGNQEAVDRLFSDSALSCMGEARQAVLMSMAHQLGAFGLSKFRRMIAALDQGDWVAASQEALDSQWARQTPARAQRAAEVLKTGKLEIPS